MTETPPGSGLEPTDPEDRKIITLATAARARTAAAGGACLRDTDGRTYAATDVALPSLRLSAIVVAVAMAVSSGAAGVEAVAVTGGPPTPEDATALAELAGHRGPSGGAGSSSSVPVWVVDPRGAVLEVRSIRPVVPGE